MPASSATGREAHHRLYGLFACSHYRRHRGLACGDDVDRARIQAHGSSERPPEYRRWLPRSTTRPPRCRAHAGRARAPGCPPPAACDASAASRRDHRRHRAIKARSACPRPRARRESRRHRRTRSQLVSRSQHSPDVLSVERSAPRVHLRRHSIGHGMQASAPKCAVRHWCKRVFDARHARRRRLAQRSDDAGR